MNPEEPIVPPADETPEPETAQDAEMSVERDLLQMATDIERLTQERDEMHQQVLRTMADFQNFRKRTQQEAATFRQLANEALVSDLLPVLDNFGRALQAAESGATLESVVEGVRLVDKQFRGVLEGYGVRAIASVGVEFDPAVHEALGSHPTVDFPEGTVAVELDPGYKMGEKVIRPARVKVASKP